MWTRLTTHTKEGNNAIKTLGGFIDKQFVGDEAAHWKRFWNNADRKTYLKTMESNLRRLTVAANNNAPLDKAVDCAHAVREAAYYFTNIRRNRLLLKSNCAGSAAEELKLILKAEMFERVFVDDNHRLRCITHPVIITAKDSKEQFAMGRYNVQLDCHSIAKGSSILCFPAHANLKSNLSIHPHIYSSGGYCGGDLLDAFGNLLTQGLFTDAMGLVLQYLSTGEGHPYRDLVYWRAGGSASACLVCASCLDSCKTIRTCRVCFAAICERCRKDYSANCPRCGHEMKISQTRKAKINVKKAKKRKKKKPASNNM